MSTNRFVTLDPVEGGLLVSKRMLMSVMRGDMMNNRCLIFLAKNHYCFSLAFGELSTQYSPLLPRGDDVFIPAVIPTVARILYDYGLPHDGPQTLPVKRRRTQGNVYFEIQRP